MRIFRYPLQVGDPEGLTFEEVEALVDTGVTFTVVPASVLQRLGIARQETVRFRLADGSIVDRDIGETQVRVDGRTLATVVVFGEDQSPALLGVYTLERALLAVDPVGQRLIPTDALLVVAQDKPDPQPASRAPGMFGPRAGAYAASRVHVRDDSLDIIQSLAALGSPGRYRWAADLGTGAGFTAFALAETCHQVVASDLTLPMLEQARHLGRERGLANLQLSRNAAESLPFADGSLDLVTTRVAGHHFNDLGRSLDEVQRVLKVGALFIMADSVAPEDDVAADWMNDVELRRDFSHVKNRKVSELEQMVAARGLEITERVDARIYLEFNNWVARTATPIPQVATLRRDFLAAPAGAREAFQIQVRDGDIHFSWPCLVFRAEKR